MATIRIKPGPGQESVWDYPRPPRLEDSAKSICVVAAGKCIANSCRTKRVLETSHPPVYYIPQDDIALQYLTPTEGRSFCEWKGEAKYYSLSIGAKSIEEVAWYYPHPAQRFAGIAGHVASRLQTGRPCSGQCTLTPGYYNSRTSAAWSASPRLLRCAAACTLKSTYVLESH